jgi:hypothetical protein
MRVKEWLALAMYPSATLTRGLVTADLGVGVDAVASIPAET